MNRPVNCCDPLPLVAAAAFFRNLAFSRALTAHFFRIGDQRAVEFDAVAVRQHRRHRHYLAENTDFGVLDIEMTSAATGDPLFAGFPSVIKALQWHGYEVRGLDHNPGVTILGSSPTTPYQIFAYREHAWAMQFHVEVRADTVRLWGEVPEYRDALETSLGAGALANLDADAAAQMPEMNRLAGLIYDNFKRRLS